MQWRNACGRTKVLCVGGALLLLAVIWFLHQRALIGLLESSLAHPMVTAILATFLWFAGASRRKQRLLATSVPSWLAAVPKDVSLLESFVAAPLIALILFFLLLGSLALSDDLSAADAALLLAFASATCVIGTSVAWFLPHTVRPKTPSSWYLMEHPARDPSMLRPSLSGLGSLALGGAKVWNRPKIRARGVLLLLVALPMGVTAGVALAAVLVWFLGLYVVTLLLAMVRASFAAAFWLAPTSIALSRLTFSIAYPAMLIQILICVIVLGAVDAIAGAAALQRATPFAIGWVVVFACAAVVATAYASRPGAVVHSIFHRWLR
jgi:hypothetical protein